MHGTESTDSPQIETACFRHVLPETADNQNEGNVHVIENKEESGGRGKDRTCDHSRVKGEQAVEIANEAQKSAESPILDLSAYRAEVIAFRNQSTGRRRSLASILARQLLEMERDPDRPGLRDLAMQTIRRLASA